MVSVCPNTKPAETIQYLLFIGINSWYCFNYSSSLVTNYQCIFWKNCFIILFWMLCQRQTSCKSCKWSVLPQDKTSRNSIYFLLALTADIVSITYHCLFHITVFLENCIYHLVFGCFVKDEHHVNHVNGQCYPKT